MAKEEVEKKEKNKKSEENLSNGKKKSSSDEKNSSKNEENSSGDKENSSGEQKDSGEKKTDETLAERTSVFEWIVAAAGLLIVLFSIGFVSVEALVSNGTPPNLEIKNETIRKLPNGYLVEFTVVNLGDTTAANAIIEGKLANGETKTVTIDYVPSKSEQKGGLFFKDDPRLSSLEIQAVGYESP